MKISFQIAETWFVCGSRSATFAALALLTGTSARCGDGKPDPLFAAGEQAIVGSYKLDNVLLASGKLVVLAKGNPLFEGMGDTPEQAFAKGLLNARQVAVLGSRNNKKDLHLPTYRYRSSEQTSVSGRLQLFEHPLRIKEAFAPPKPVTRPIPTKSLPKNYG